MSGGLIDEHVSVQQCKRAVEALLKHATKFEEKKAESQLLAGKEQNVWLVVNTKVMHPEKKLKPARIPVKYPIVDPRTSPVCLITKDPQREYKDLIAKEGIKFISRVVDVRHLKGKWKPFEARRMLLKENGLFLTDERVVPLLPALLGKIFFRAKKQPIPVCITRKDLKGELERAISSTYFHQNQGTCTSVKIGTVSQNATQVIANLQTALPEVVKHIKGGWDNVQSFFLKTNSSASLPIWQCDLGAESGGRWEGLVASLSDGEDSEMDASEGEDEDEDVEMAAEESAASPKAKGKKRSAEEAEVTEKPKKKAKAAESTTSSTPAPTKTKGKAAAAPSPAVPAAPVPAEPAKKRRKSEVNAVTSSTAAPKPKVTATTTTSASSSSSAAPAPAPANSAVDKSSDAAPEKEKRKRRKSQAASTEKPVSSAAAASSPSDAKGNNTSALAPAHAEAEADPHTAAAAASTAGKKEKRKSRAAAVEPSDATVPAAPSAPAEPVTPSVQQKKARAAAVDFFDNDNSAAAAAATPNAAKALPQNPPNTPADGLGDVSGKRKRRKSAVADTPVTNALAKLAAAEVPAAAGEEALETPSGKKLKRRKGKGVAAELAAELQPAAEAQGKVQEAVAVVEDTATAPGEKKRKRKHKEKEAGAADEGKAPATVAPSLSAEEMKQKKSASGLEKKKEKALSGGKHASAGKSAKTDVVGKKAKKL